MGTFVRHVCLSLAVMASVIGCSPYNFGEEVKGIGTSVRGAATAINAGHASLDADRATLLHIQRVNDRVALDLTNSCAVAAPDQACALTTRRPLATAAAAKWDQDQQLAFQKATEEANTRKKMANVLAALTDYVGGLEAVTNADDRAQLQAAAGRLGSAIGSLATAAGPAGAEVAVVAPAVTNAVFWGVGVALDWDRFHALRQATARAAEPFKAGATVIAQGLGRVRAERMIVLRRMAELENRQLVRDPGSYDRHLTTLEDLVARLEAMRRSDPNTFARQLVAAHEALVTAINDPNRQIGSLITTLQELRAQVAALQQALAAVKK